MILLKTNNTTQPIILNVRIKLHINDEQDTKSYLNVYIDNPPSEPIIYASTNNNIPVIIL